MALQFVPVTPNVGVEIRGLDLSATLDEETIAAVRQAFRDHHLLLVRQRGVSDDDQLRFARLFGEVKLRRPRPNEDPNNATQYVSNTRHDGILGQGEIVFHQDHLFYDSPLKAIALYGVQIPQSGSATKFRNASTLLADLPAGLADRARSVRCLHLFNYLADYTQWQDPATAPPDSPRAWQPMVWTNPETAKDALWISPLDTVDYDGVSLDEGRRLMDELSDAASAVENAHTYVHQWAPGDLVLWDNRMLHHARLPFDSNEPRTLRRSAIL
jgi:taurine dioxygenase